MLRKIFILSALIAAPLMAEERSNLLLGEFSLAKGDDGCAQSLNIQKDDEKKCWLISAGQTEEVINICNVNKGVIVSEISVSEAEGEGEGEDGGETRKNRVYETTMHTRLGTVLTTFKTRTVKGLFYQNIDQTITTSVFAAAKEQIVVTNTFSHLMRNILTEYKAYTCSYQRVAQ